MCWARDRERRTLLSHPAPFALNHALDFPSPHPATPCPQARRGLTIAQLATRLSRFGFFHRHNAKPEDWGDRLALTNLLDTRNAMKDGERQQLHIRVDTSLAVPASLFAVFL